MKKIIPIIIIGAILTSCATGPTPEQLAAQAEEQRQAQIAQEEAAKKQAEEEAAAKAALDAQIAKVHADEKAGDDAAQAGDLQKALTNYMTAFDEAPQPDIKNDAQAKIARFAGTLSNLPEVPEEAVRHSVHANVHFKAGEYGEAVSEMQAAVQLAPWWADGYYNLGLMQEGAQQYGDAIASLKLFLLAAPKSPEAHPVQNKIYELEVAKEDVDKKNQLAGDWISESGKHYHVTIQGNKIGIKKQSINSTDNNSDGVSTTIQEQEKDFTGVIRQSSINGTVSIPEVDVTIHNNSQDSVTIYRLNLTISYIYPSEVVPFSGTIAEDGNSIELRWTETTYTVSAYSYTHPTLFASAALVQAPTVSVAGKQDINVKLARP